jgi:hypothetical protein
LNGPTEWGAKACTPKVISQILPRREGIVHIARFRLPGVMHFAHFAGKILS